MLTAFRGLFVFTLAAAFLLVSGSVPFFSKAVAWDQPSAESKITQPVEKGSPDSLASSVPLASEEDESSDELSDDVSWDLLLQKFRRWLPSNTFSRYALAASNEPSSHIPFVHHEPPDFS